MAAKSVRLGIPIPIVHGNQFRIYSRAGFELIHSWLSVIVQTVGDFDPASEKVYLPPEISKRDAYRAFRHESLQTGTSKEDLPCERYFKAIWTKCFPTLKCVRKNRLGICNKCCDLRSYINNATNITERDELTRVLYKHLDQVKRGMLFL